MVSDTVDDRVDARIDVDNEDGNVVRGCGEVNQWMTDKVGDVVDLVTRPTRDEEHGNGR